MIAACVLGCVGVAGFYLVTAGRLYEATAKLLVLQSGGSPLAAVGGEVAGPVRGAEDEIPTHAMLVGSSVVVHRAIESVGLKNLPSVGGAGGVDAAVRKVIENLSVSRPDRQAKILTITYRARSPDEAVRVVRAVVDSYKAFLEEVYARTNGDVVVLMSRARDDLNGELKGLEHKYLEFRKKTPQLMGDGTGRTVVQNRNDEWDRAAREAMVKAVQLKAQVELGRELAREGVGLWSLAYALDQLGGGGANGLGPRTQTFGPAPPSEYLRLLANEQQQFAERLGPQSTKVKDIQEQITAAQSQSRQAHGRLEEAEVRELLASIEKSHKAVESMRGEIQKRFDLDMVLAKEVEIDQLTETNLKNEMQRQQKLFDTVVEQLDRAKLVGDYSGTRSQVIEPPNAQPSPVRPLASLVLVVALAAGCVLGIGTALGAELIDPRVRSVAEMRRALPLPVSGQVPFVPETEATRVGPVGLMCHAMPRSPSAEAYRMIGANLDLARRGRAARVVMVTSPHGAEGRSTVASNLAVALAQAGRRILLVDADLRSPALHRTFGLSRERGLVHLLRDLLPMARVIQTTLIPNLDLICSGPEVVNPAELLSSSYLTEILARFRDAYETVVIDAPSLLSVADPSIIGAVSDGIVLVVRVSATKRADVRRAAETLQGLGTPVLGAVINGTSQASARWPWPRPSAAVVGPAWGGPASVEIPFDPRLSSFPAGAVDRTAMAPGQALTIPLEGQQI